MNAQLGFFIVAGVAVFAMLGLLVVAAAEELRHRRNERTVNMDALVTAFRIHEVATSAREAMGEELARLREEVE